MILEKDLESALEEVDLLQIKLKEADGRIRTLEESATPPPEGSDQTAAQAEYFASISQELRQPLSSMSGYTDLLLSESVGILGALQRKFLERIKASAERMGGLIEDLVQATMLETDRQKLTAIPIDFSTVIDEAIAVTAPQIREKRISLRLDLPGDFPQIKADPDALQQVLINLLQNAGSATPSQGEICLRGRVEQGEDHLDYIFIQVSDMGGGIPPSDLPRVFSRLYRNDNILIQGVGDTGMGLSMVKTLIEAHGGRIWVDTEMGKGSTFSVLLPVSDQKLSPDGYRGRMQ
jgi:two-component system phosphate regulon sensor histidine kinase PhoR